MKITEYIKQTRAEMSHVTWPSREQTIRFTSLVIVVSLATALILGVADFVFSKLLTLLFH
jgi:preprotein translocase subunit SecE